MRCALLWGITQRTVVIPYWRFETTYRPNQQESTSLSPWVCCPLKMGPIGCPEISVRNYHSTLSTSPEEHRSNVKLTLTFSKLCVLTVNTGNTAKIKATTK